MKQLISFVILATLLYSNSGFAAKKIAQIKVRTISTKSNGKTKWNEVCRDLLDSSVNSTLKLEKSVNKNHKLTRNDFDEKIQGELLVVQLNAWVCALSTKSRMGASAEEMFIKDFQKRVQSKKL
jgi:hypothetical protein